MCVCVCVYEVIRGLSVSVWVDGTEMKRFKFSNTYSHDKILSQEHHFLPPLLQDHLFKAYSIDPLNVLFHVRCRET